MEFQELAEKIDSFLKDNPLTTIKLNEGLVIIDFADLLKFDFELAQYAIDDPENFFAMAKIKSEEISDSKKKVNVRISGLSQLPLQSIKRRIRDIRVEDIGKLTYIEGIIRQVSSVIPIIESASYECSICGNTITVKAKGNRLFRPSKCLGCKKTNSYRKLTEFKKDAQKVIIEEAIDSLEGHQQPRRLNIILYDDLTSQEIDKLLGQGNKVAFSGVIKDVLLKDAPLTTEREWLMEANFLFSLEETLSINITEKDEERIKALAENDALNQLKDSLCVSIIGQEDVKRALILQMVGGNTTPIEGESESKNRGTIHVLLIGDPSSGKSRLENATISLCPKARGVSGEGASGAGLTAAVVKDDFLGGWAVEAGAMVLANGSVAIIDEFDKVKDEDKQRLYYAMSDCKIKIDKATIHTVLQAETGLLCGANTKGRLELGNLAQSINMSAALLSRFDFIFLFEDKIDEQRDTKIAQAMMAARRGSDKIKPKIEPLLFKKFISYARRFKPEITAEAAEEAMKFWLYLRKRKSTTTDQTKAVKITTRQLEAITRLAEAHAKLRLSDKVTVEDVKIVTPLFISCLEKVAIDPETGEMDIDMLERGESGSHRGKKQLQIETLFSLFDKFGQLVPFSIILEELGPIMTHYEIETLISKLLKEGEIYEPKPNHYKRVREM